MNDIVERLRKAFRTFPVIEDSPVDLFKDAADRIEQLQAANKLLIKENTALANHGKKTTGREKN